MIKPQCSSFEKTLHIEFKIPPDRKFSIGPNELLELHNRSSRTKSLTWILHIFQIPVVLFAITFSIYFFHTVSYILCLEVVHLTDYNLPCIPSVIIFQFRYLLLMVITHTLPYRQPSIYDQLLIQPPAVTRGEAQRRSAEAGTGRECQDCNATCM